MSSPTVSVILPVYNGEQYLRFAIESVLGQTFQDFELIVVDDGSTDSTPAVVAGYYGRVRYVRQSNTGVSGAFNHGLRLANGRYISWLSHDDAFLPAKLAQQVAALSRLNVPAVCYTDIQTINARGNVVGELRMPEYKPGEALRHVLTGGAICSAPYSIMYDRRCIEEVGPYAEEWRYTQDADMLVKLVKSFPLIRVPEVLMQVREHENRGIRSKNWEREVVGFYREHLKKLSFEELFPSRGVGASRADRARAFLWVGDAFVAQPWPLYRVAFSQYRRALRENPAGAATPLRKMAWLWRHHIRQHSNWRRLKEKLSA